MDSGGNMAIGVQVARKDITIRRQHAARDMTVGAQLAGGHLTIGDLPVVQSACRMAEVGFDKVVGAIAVVLGIIFRIVKAVFVADCDPPSSEEVNKNI